jgi:hypothetical protein
MLAIALQQWGEVGHTALAVHVLTFPSIPTLLALDREDGIFHQEHHRCISSPSQTDPPSVFS